MGWAGIPFAGDLRMPFTGTVLPFATLFPPLAMRSGTAPKRLLVSSEDLSIGLEKVGIDMGLFGKSLNDKIRDSASVALPQARWNIDVDWSTGEKLHRLNGTLSEPHTDAETMQLARTVWSAVAQNFRIHPDDRRDGLLDVRLSAAGGAVQCSGTCV